MVEITDWRGVRFFIGIYIRLISAQYSSFGGESTPIVSPIMSFLASMIIANTPSHITGLQLIRDEPQQTTQRVHFSRTFF